MKMSFIRKSFLAIILLLSYCKVMAQTPSFSKTNKKFSEERLMPRINVPEKFHLFDANFQAINDYLLGAPMESEGQSIQYLINLPDADGNIAPYAVYKSPVMEPELAEEFPGLYSYVAYNTKDLTNNVRFTVSYIHGIHLMGYNGKGDTYYIDTYTQDLNSYILYNKKDIQEARVPFECHTHSAEDQENVERMPVQAFSQDSKFRQYRLAMACTIEYAAYHINNAPAGTPTSTTAQKKAVVLSAMQVTVARVNTVYERDLSVRLVLVANNSNIIFVTSDSFDNDDSSGQLIYQSQSVIDATIGNANYDIGHTVSTGGGGLAQLGAVCKTGQKAQGITGSPAPVGDPYDIDYVAHEMGHQFGADHTFNGNTGSCSGNISTSNISAEPGSGSTIMAYAGICTGQNVQNNSDAYFHYYSIKQIYEYLTQYASCASILSTANPAPTADAGSNYTIPKGTPFKLTASATDTNNPNTLTYAWEQLDYQQVTYPLTGNLSYGPNFRSLMPTSNNFRYFPALATVLSGTTSTTVAPGSTWERLPNVARTMKFGVTVRDNNPINGGQTKRDETTITVANAGPFVLTYPNNVASSVATQWLLGSTQTITWNVAGTTSNGINTQSVNILYTTDEGQTFTTLVENTPNDGSQEITVPANLPVNTEIRIMIQPVNNIYYAISKKVVLVNELSNKDFQFEKFQLYPNPTSENITISFKPQTSENIVYQVFDTSGRRLFEKEIENNTTIEETFSTEQLSTGTYLIRIINGKYSMTAKFVRR